MNNVHENIAIYGTQHQSIENLVSAIIGRKASEVCKKYSNLVALSKASIADLLHCGLSTKQATTLQACLELARRLSATELTRGSMLNSTSQVFGYFKDKLKTEKKEHFIAILLDAKHKIIKEIDVSVGSLNFSIVHPREVFSLAISEHAESLLLVHNHPSGDPTHSREDIAVTKRLCEVGKLVGIEILDHMIIGGDSYFSFLEQNLMIASTASAF